jgi:Uma2 family endonuclease
MVALAHQKLTPQEYLEIERRAERKSEFFNGEMWAMVGAGKEHVAITLNVGSEFRQQLKGRPCSAYVADLRVAVSDSGLYTYPDVVVVCGEARFDDEHPDTLLNPTLIVEVPSESTEAYDRGDKFAHYQRLPSLREYVLIAQDRVRVEHYSRQSGGQWLLTVAERLEDTVELPAIGCRLSLAEVYDKVELPPQPPPLRAPITPR